MFGSTYVATPIPTILPAALARDSLGNLYFADGLGASDLLRIVDGVSGVLKTVAGGGSPPDGLGDGGPPRAALFGRTAGLLIQGTSVILADNLHRRSRSLDLTFTVIRTAALNGAERFSGDGGPPRQALLARPGDLALARDGQIFVATKGADGKWSMEKAAMAGLPTMPYMLAFAQDDAGEVYALTSISTGPSDLVCSWNRPSNLSDEPSRTVRTAASPMTRATVSG